MFRVGDRVRFATCHGIGEVVEAPHEGCCGSVRIRWESGLLQWYGMESPFLELVQAGPTFSMAKFEAFAAKYGADLQRVIPLTYELPSKKYDHTEAWRQRFWLGFTDVCAMCVGPQMALLPAQHTPDAASVEHYDVASDPEWLGAYWSCDDLLFWDGLIKPPCVAHWMSSTATIDQPQVTLCQ